MLPSLHHLAPWLVTTLCGAMVMGCPSDDAGDETTTAASTMTSATSPTSTSTAAETSALSSSSDTTASPSCGDQDDCQKCLAVPSCNWTEGICADECFADGDCYGPGNPGAPDCPQ